VKLIYKNLYETVNNKLQMPNVEFEMLRSDKCEMLIHCHIKEDETLNG